MFRDLSHNKSWMKQLFIIKSCLCFNVSQYKTVIVLHLLNVIYNNFNCEFDANNKCGFDELFIYDKSILKLIKLMVRCMNAVFLLLIALRKSALWLHLKISQSNWDRDTFIPYPKPEGCARLWFQHDSNISYLGKEILPNRL